MRSLSELLVRSADFGDQEYVVSGDRRLTFAENERWARRIAGALVNTYGLKKGDRVAIAGPNSLEWVAAFWAVVSLGGIVVGLNAWWQGEELLEGIADSDPILLIADEERLRRINATGSPLAVPVVEIEQVATRLDGSPVQEWPELAEDDPATILFTSGTTGRSKGAVHTHRNMIALVQLQAYLVTLRPTPPGYVAPPARIFTSSPLFHVSGLHAGIVAAASSGATFLWREGRFDTEDVMRTMEREKVTSWSTVPTAVWRVVNHPNVGSYDLSTVKHVGGGASAWSEALQLKMKEVFGETHVTGVGYGLTECTGLATRAGNAELADHPDTVGKPLPTVAVEVRDGEVFIRSPLVMLEYFRNPEATALAITPDRWLRTGDLGHMEDGMLFLSARRYDLIKRAGENVYPVEIENVLEGHPAVLECVVVGTDHEDLGQEVTAVVVLNHEVAESDLADYVGQRLGSFKVPTRWIVRSESLPRTATEKVIRAQVLQDLA